MYLLQIVVLAFLPHNDFDYSRLDGVKEGPKAMTVPMVVITVMMVVLSLASKPLFAVISTIANGGF